MTECADLHLVSVLCRLPQMLLEIQLSLCLSNLIHVPQGRQHLLKTHLDSEQAHWPCVVAAESKRKTCPSADALDACVAAVA